MRLILATLALVFSSSCSQAAEQNDVSTPGGVRLCIGDDAAPYEDVVGPLRRDEFEQLIQSSNNARYISPPGGVSPRVCDARTSPKVMIVTYPPRDDQHVGATLRLYFGSGNEVKLAEFYVTDLMP